MQYLNSDFDWDLLRWSNGPQPEDTVDALYQTLGQSTYFQTHYPTEWKLLCDCVAAKTRRYQTQKMFSLWKEHKDSWPQLFAIQIGGMNPAGESPIGKHSSYEEWDRSIAAKTEKSKEHDPDGNY